MQIAQMSTMPFQVTGFIGKSFQKKEVQQQKLHQYDLIDKKIVLQDSTYLNKFAMKKQIKMYTCYLRKKNLHQRHLLKVSLKIFNLCYVEQVARAIQLHVNNSSPFIQNYQSVSFSTTHNSVCLRCQPYRFTLDQILRALKSQNCPYNKIKKSFFVHLANNLLNAYLYILHLLKQQKNQKEQLHYGVSANNILICRDYSIKLGFIGFQNDSIFSQILVYKKEIIRPHLRNQIIDLMTQLELKYLQGQFNPQFGQIIKLTDKNAQLRISQQFNRVKYWRQQIMKLQRIDNLAINIFLREISKYIKGYMNEWFIQNDRKMYEYLKNQNSREFRQNQIRQRDHPIVNYNNLDEINRTDSGRLNLLSTGSHLRSSRNSQS